MGAIFPLETEQSLYRQEVHVQWESTSSLERPSFIFFFIISAGAYKYHSASKNTLVMTGVFQSKQRKDFSVEEHDNLSKISISKYQEPVCVQIWHFQLFPNIRGSIYLFSHVVKCRSFLCSLRFCFHFSQIWEAAFTFLAMLRLNMASNPENPLNAILVTAENDIWQDLSI